MFESGSGLPKLTDLVLQLAAILIDNEWKIAVAESCTGGWIAKILTDLPGSSRWFELGVVCYANSSKEKILDVPGSLLEAHGAVSESVAMAMVRGISNLAEADVGVSVTGIAGPDGGSKEKPVGTVCLGFFFPNNDIQAKTLVFSGNREKIRQETVKTALEEIITGLRSRS